MIRTLAWLLVAVALSMATSHASARDKAAATIGPETTGTADGRPAPAPRAAAPPGTILGRQGLPIARDAVQRGQRSFKRCNEEALLRKLRGAERRHFVARCRLGYGRRLFRRVAPPA